MPRELSSQVKICNETFKRIEANLSYIKDSIDEHKKRSDDRQSKFNQLITDVEVIKTNVSNHLQHHTEIKQEFQWRTGLIVGIITFVITIGVNVGIKLFGGN